jgi:hypothetical protein
MAKRKAAGITRRKAARKSSAASRKRAPARKTASRKSAAKKSARKKTSRSAAAKAAHRTRDTRAVKQARTRVAKKAVATRKAAGGKVVRKAPALDRARRTVQGDDIVPTPPSSLNMDRTASAARSGRREMRERLDQHTETSPALTAGDVDADWEGAYSSGDEAPGGDNPTPDQDVVDDIGKAVGVQYEDNEELKGEAKITKRDKHRWELDPASSEDYKDR